MAPLSTKESGAFLFCSRMRRFAPKAATTKIEQMADSLRAEETRDPVNRRDLAVGRVSGLLPAHGFDPFDGLFQPAEGVEVQRADAVRHGERIAARSVGEQLADHRFGIPFGE